MDTLTSVLIAAFFVGLTALVIWAVRRESERQARVEAAWRQYAARRHLTWIDSSGPWYRRRSYRMSGSVAGAPVMFEQFIVSTGKSSARFTRATRELPRPAQTYVRACQDSLFGRLEAAFRGPVVELEGAHAAGVHMRCESAAFARSIATPRFCAALLAMPPRTRFELSDQVAKAWWRGGELDPAVLDRAAELLASAGA